MNNTRIPKPRDQKPFFHVFNHIGNCRIPRLNHHMRRNGTPGVWREKPVTGVLLFMLICVIRIVGQTGENTFINEEMPFFRESLIIKCNRIPQWMVRIIRDSERFMEKLFSEIPLVETDALVINTCVSPKPGEKIKKFGNCRWL